MPLLGWLVVVLAVAFVLVAVREVLAIRWWPRRCAAVLEPGVAGSWFGRCELRARHGGAHELDRGMDRVLWRSVLGEGAEGDGIEMLVPAAAPLVVTPVDYDAPTWWHEWPAQAEVDGSLSEWVDPGSVLRARRQVRASIEEALGPEPVVSKWSRARRVRMVFEWPSWWARGDRG